MNTRGITVEEQKDGYYWYINQLPGEGGKQTTAAKAIGAALLNLNYLLTVKEREIAQLKQQLEINQIQQLTHIQG